MKRNRLGVRARSAYSREIMETLEEKVGDVKILHLRGRLDLAASPPFESLVKGLIAGGETKLVMDCHDLKYVSSSGLGALIACGKQLGENGSLVFAGLSSNIESLFEMTGIASLFTIVKTKEDALEKLSASQ